MKSQPKHPGVKKVAAKNLKKALLKRCEIKINWQATVMFGSLIIIIKNFIPSTAGGLDCPF